MGLSKELVITEYENMLLNAVNGGPTMLFHSSAAENKKQGGIIWRYAVEKLLGWTPKQAELYLTPEIIKKLKLTKTFGPMGIEFGARKYFSVKKVLAEAFPERVTYNYAEEAIDEYKRINKLDQWANNTDLQRYHRNFFQGAEGRNRATAIIDYVISTYFGDHTMPQIYNFFGSPYARKWIREHGLQIMSPFPTSCTVDFLYFLSSYQDDLLYANEKLKERVRVLKAEERKLMIKKGMIPDEDEEIFETE